MTDTSSFQAVKSDVSSPDDKDFNALLPTTPLFIPEYTTRDDPRPRQSVAVMPGVTMTTIIIVGCVVTSCVLLALLAAAILKHKRSRVKRIEDVSKIKCDKSGALKEKQVSHDGDIYSEIETKGSCCFSLCRRDKYTVSSTDHIDNIYAEVSDIVPAPPLANIGREVIYETLDGKDWSRSRSKSQGANDIPKCNMPPKIYDHLSFEELERLRLENPNYLPDRKKVSSNPEQMSTAYDRLDRSPPNLSTSDDLDDPDGNNNSLVRRLSQKQILKKLFVIDSDNIRRNRPSPTKRHDYFEIENVSQVSRSTEDSEDVPPPQGHEYFVLEDVCEPGENGRRHKPPVPTRTCSLRSSVHGNRCVSFPCRSVPTQEDMGRRVKSFPDRPGEATSRDTISVVSSAVSSEGVYNITTGHAKRYSSDGRQHDSDVCLRSPRHDYFVLDPVFINSDTSASSIQSDDHNLEEDGGPSVDRTGRAGDYFVLEPTAGKTPKEASACGYRNDYFVLESETEDNFKRPATFHIVEDNDVPSYNYRQFSRQVSEPVRTDREGVTVVKLRGAGSDDKSCAHAHENPYDRLRFKSVSAKQKSDFRPRLLSTPNNIDF